MQFTITQNHLLLLNRFFINDYKDDNEIAVNTKRPFGNSDYLDDICEILGFKQVEVNFQEMYLTKDLEYAGKIFSELATALQICLVRLKFEEGVFEKKNEYENRSWEVVSYQN
jgi:hypothetical protein